MTLPLAGLPLMGQPLMGLPLLGPPLAALLPMGLSPNGVSVLLPPELPLGAAARYPGYREVPKQVWGVTRSAVPAGFGCLPARPQPVSESCVSVASIFVASSGGTLGV